MARAPANAALALGALVTACNVPLPHRSAGAGPLPDAASGMDGSAACGRGVFVVEEGVNYDSTNVALLSLTGGVLQGSVASSATASVGLTAPLSGDVVPPTGRLSGHEIVLIDHAQGTNRIVFVDIESAAATRRFLPVGTGFWSNPYDYAPVSPAKAYVPRYGENDSPGAQPFDTGSDLLIVNPSSLSITGSIDLRTALGKDSSHATANPASAVVVGDRTFVLLATLTAFAGVFPSRVVAVDNETDTITDVLVLDGFENCSGLGVSPSQKALAVFCSGSGSIQTSPTALDGSGVVLVDVNATPAVAKTFLAADLGKNRVGFYGDFSSENALVFQTFGYDDVDTGSSSKDALLRLDIETGEHQLLLDGPPFSIGGIACDAACGACFVADSDRMGGVVHRYALDPSGRLSGDRLIKAEQDVGLPPRTLGKF